MKRRMTGLARPAPALILALGLAPPAAGAMELETLGEIHVEFDGEAFTRPTVFGTEGGDSAATATFMRTFGPVVVALFGTPGPQLSIDLQIGEDFALGDAPERAVISYFPGEVFRHWTSEDAAEDAAEPPRVTLTRFELDGESGHIAGTFAASLCLVDGPRAKPDPDNCKPVSGSFDTRIIED